MAINQAVCATFKQQVLLAEHSLTANTINLALFTSSAALDANTAAYSVTNEVPNSGTYAAGGGTLASATVGLTKTNSHTNILSLPVMQVMQVMLMQRLQF